MVMFDDVPPAPAAESSATSSSPAVLRFQSCRWYCAPDHGTPHCSHRDVQPYAGTTGFNPEAWCPDCAFYKVRRTTRKRSPDDLNY